MKEGMFLSSILRLVRERHYWSPFRLARILWGVSTNIVWQFRIWRILMLTAFKGLFLIDPRLQFKYLTRNYLARGLTVAERASCFIRHYRHLQARFPANLLRQTLQRYSTVLEMQEGGNHYCITMGLSREEVREGELCLHLRVNETVVFALQFTIVPGWIVGSETADALLISRLQGSKGCYDQIQLATKALHDVAPAALLVSALMGIAEACEIRKIAGVSAGSQLSYSESHSVLFKEAYDDFFTELGATRTTPIFFAGPIPLPEKPITLVKKGHKTRTREKRAFKQQIADEVCRRLQESK
jgi:hypothetical protein